MTHTTPVVHGRVEGRDVIAAEPEGRDAGQLALDLASLFARARQANADVLPLRPTPLAHDVLFALQPVGVHVLDPHGSAQRALAARWRARRAAVLRRRRSAQRAASFWFEIGRELKEHAGDERLPNDLRGWLRTSAQRAAERFRLASCAAAGASAFARRLLREPVDTQLPPELALHAREAADRVGLPGDCPIAALEIRSRVHLFDDAIDDLERRGYRVVRIGGKAAGPLRRGDAIDTASSAHAGPLLDVYVLLAARFVVCETPELQQMAYLTNTPSLTVNASEVFAQYPIRADGLFTLQTAIDLDTGRALSLPELLTEGFFRNRRNYGYRPNSRAEIAEAVREIRQTVDGERQETPAQGRFRDRVVDAGRELSPRVGHVAAWGPDDGFIGDGRLVSFQAERA